MSLTLHPRAATLSCAVGVVLLVASCGGGEPSTAAQDATASGEEGGDGVGAADTVAEADSGPDEGGCTSDVACQLILDDPPPCRVAACVAGACALVDDAALEGETCAPEDKCLADGVCVEGACSSSSPRDCSDDDACTIDDCDPVVGCLLDVADDGTACDDGDPCTEGDACAGGECVATPLDCDDGDPCTEGDACVDGTCVAGEVAPCDDGNECTIDDACDPASGACVGDPTEACDCTGDADCADVEDGDLCNGTLHCDGGACVVDAATIVHCPDPAGACEVATCDSATGACGTAPAEVGTACDDGDACTQGDACDDAGSCVGGAALDCEDDNPCTEGTCVDGTCEYVFDPLCGCEGLDCPPDGELGDALKLQWTHGSPVETVGATIIDGHVFTCGGFGMDVYRINEDPYGFSHMSSGIPRCQNIEGGKAIGDTRIVYVTHHGDAYVKVPALHTLKFLPGSGTFTTLDSAALDGLSPEGLAWDADNDLLWVAMHEAGVYRYDVMDDGTLVLLDQLDGFTNAYRLVVSGGHVYVADGGGGLEVVDRTTGAIVGGISTAGFAKDIEVTGTMALVAASSLGVHAIDVSDPTAPQPIEVVFTYGSALTADLLMNGTRLAVATVDEVAVLDVSHPDALKILASDKGTNKSVSARNLTVAAEDHLLVSGEWLGIGLLTWEEGLIAPELHLDRNSLTLGGVDVGEDLTELVGVTNRGWLPLEITDISPTNSKEWTVTPSTMTLQPGETQPLVVTFAPASAGTSASAIVFASNDPDEATLSFPIVGNPTTGKLDVGEALTSQFDFLDTHSPEGEKAIENLHGNVLVLAYFATF